MARQRPGGNPAQEPVSPKLIFMRSPECNKELALQKERVKRSFSRKACVYDQNAVLQQETGQKLLEDLKLRATRFNKILDIGMGTGWLTHRLANIYPDAFILGFDLARGMVDFAAGQEALYVLEADAENLPFRTEIFDLAVSNLTYQWVDDLKTAFGCLNNVLTPGALFKFTTLGQKTLSELHNAYKYAHQKLEIPLYPHGQRFIGRQELISGLKAAGFTGIDFKVEHKRRTYVNVMELARSLKNIGAANAMSGSNKGLGGRKLFQQMSGYYRDHYACPGGIYATFEIFSVEAQKNIKMS